MIQCIEINSEYGHILAEIIEKTCREFRLTKQNIISINTAYDTSTDRFHAFITYEE